MAIYQVRAWGGSRYTVAAVDSTAAKKLVCKMLSRTASAPLIGVKGMTAKRV